MSILLRRWAEIFRFNGMYIQAYKIPIVIYMHSFMIFDDNNDIMSFY